MFISIPKLKDKNKSYHKNAQFKILKQMANNQDNPKNIKM